MTQTKSELVGLGGLEPPTSPLSGVRSNQLIYRPNLFLLRSFTLLFVMLILSLSHILMYAPSLFHQQASIKVKSLAKSLPSIVLLYLN